MRNMNVTVSAVKTAKSLLLDYADRFKTLKDRCFLLRCSIPETLETERLFA